jgi:hypothetical protein
MTTAAEAVLQWSAIVSERESLEGLLGCQWQVDTIHKSAVVELDIHPSCTLAPVLVVGTYTTVELLSISNEDRLDGGELHAAHVRSTMRETAGESTQKQAYPHPYWFWVVGAPGLVYPHPGGGGGAGIHGYHVVTDP